MFLRLPRQGEVIGGQFVLRREIGRGAMGVVYEAHQAGLERRVALKILHPKALINEGVVERFEREARLASTLTHPNSIAIYAYGIHRSSEHEPVDGTPEGLPYLVMEYLAGEDLAAYLLRKQRLPLDEALEILRQTLACLTAAHKRGIIHRDLKPQNIFLVEDPGHEGHLSIKVLDFGLARALYGEWGGSMTRRLTDPGVVCGTPEFMAPEQATADWDITPAVDTYALGCLLYQLLAGDPPFVGSNPLEIAAQHVSKSPPPLPETYRDTMVELVVQRALAKRPSHRFQDAQEMALAIDEIGIDGSAINAWKVECPEWALATIESKAFSPEGIGNQPMAVQVNAASDALETNVVLPAFTGRSPTLTASPAVGGPHDDTGDTDVDAPPALGIGWPDVGQLGASQAPCEDEPELLEDPQAVTNTEPDLLTPGPGLAASRNYGIETLPSQKALVAVRTATKRKRKRKKKGNGGSIAILLAAGWLVVSLVFAIGVVVIYGLPEASSTSEARDAVELTVQTSPEGAEIFNGDVRLGVSPLTVTRPRSKRELKLTLTKPGYVDQVAIVQLSDSAVVSLELERVPGPGWVQ